MGEIGMDVDYFYSLTPRQFNNCLKGFRSKEEIKEKANWERSRWQMYYSLVAFQGAEKLRVEDVLAFPWDVVAEIDNRKPMKKSELIAYWKEYDLKQLKHK